MSSVVTTATTSLKKINVNVYVGAVVVEGSRVKLKFYYDFTSTHNDYNNIDDGDDDDDGNQNKMREQKQRNLKSSPRLLMGRIYIL